MSSTKSQKNDTDTQAIALLTDLISRYKSGGFESILADCNDFGNPELNILYSEVYKASKFEMPILTLAGAGMFFEQFGKEMWVSSKLHEEQLKAHFTTWDEVMSRMEALYSEVESRKVTYTSQIRPALVSVLTADDLEALESLWDFIRNNVIHTSRIRLLSTLSEHGVIGKRIPVGKRTFSKHGVPNDEVVEMSVTHPLVIKLGFQAIAKQLSPALVIFIFDIFHKYHKHLAPPKDIKLGFSGHSCEYD